MSQGEELGKYKVWRFHGLLRKLCPEINHKANTVLHKGLFIFLNRCLFLSLILQVAGVVCATGEARCSPDEFACSTVAANVSCIPRDFVCDADSDCSDDR